MPYQTFLSVEHATCQKAVEAFAAELRKAGIQVDVREVGPDVELAGTQGEHTLCIEWLEPPASCPHPREDWEEADEAEGGPSGGRAALRTVSHYGGTLELLGRDVAAAAALLERLGGGGRPRGPARGRT